MFKLLNKIVIVGSLISVINFGVVSARTSNEMHQDVCASGRLMPPIDCLPVKLPKHEVFKDFGILRCHTMCVVR